ncbi:MAG: tyrosine-protein phosphatase [Candidatus Coproplasma sp.]
MHTHIKRLPLKKLFNTRDLGGFVTEDGRKIKKGKLIRSGKLYKIPPETVDALKKLGVNTVVDLRIFTEIEQAPDTLWEGLKYVHQPLLCTATTGITRDKSMRITMVKEARRIKSEFGTADNYMAAMYRSILMSEEPKRHLTAVLREIIENEGCILWHCSGGKDRAGIVAMLVECLLGVPEEVILADFMASAHFQRNKFFWNRVAIYTIPATLRFKRILLVMMAAKPRFLMDAVDEIKEKYGSVVNYCKAELGVTDEDIEKMKAKYLE